MSRRRFVILAYDVAHPNRLRRVHKVVKGYGVGGQKSVFECFVSDGELIEMKRRVGECLNPNADRVHILRLHGRAAVHVLGRGVAPRNPPFFYFG